MVYRPRKSTGEMLEVVRMDVRRAAFAFVLLTCFSGQAIAQKRITDLSGREVSVGSAVVLKTARRVIKNTSLHPIASSIVTVNAGPDIDAANNDYRRIQNALN